MRKRVSTLNLITIGLLGLLCAYVLTMPKPMSAQAEPSVTATIRPDYTFFPQQMNCSEVIEGEGLTIGIVTIGKTTLQEVKEIYSEHYNVRIRHTSTLGEVQIELHQPDDGTLFQRFDVCAEDDVIMTSNREFPSFEIFHNLYRDEPPNPATFSRVTIETFVRRYGMPDNITYTPSPWGRVAFWFEQGMAAAFYIRPDPPGAEYPAFGALSGVVYFPFQSSEGYEDRWPFSETFPESRYMQYVAPYARLDGISTERNPFDLERIIGTMTAQPTSSHTATPTPEPTP